MKNPKPESKSQLKRMLIVNEGMLVTGYITRTILAPDDVVVYGPFETLEEAEKWSKNLVQPTTLEAIYYPSFNRG